MTESGAPPSQVKYPAWQRQYEAALLEPDHTKLRPRIHAAEAAIFARLQELSTSAEHEPERQAIADALNILLVLKRDELGFPDWEEK